MKGIVGISTRHVVSPIKLNSIALGCICRSENDPVRYAEPVHKFVYRLIGSRTRLNLMGALNLTNISRAVIREYNKINSHNIARFFIAIRETYPIKQKVHIILDGAEYHRTEQVKTWAYLLNTELHYLPPYSPNLNPIERLWKVMNERVRNNRYFASSKVFREEIRRFFSDKLPAIAGTLVDRINDNFPFLKNATSG